MAKNSSNHLAIILIILVLQQTSAAADHGNYFVKTKVFRSPEIVLEPGLVSDKNYYDVDFPRGHIAIKSFNAELVDERENPVPLHETYLHHWVLDRYYAPKNSDHRSDHTIIRNSGICHNTLKQYFGIGAETRRTATDIPDPYGIQVGDPAGIPAGYEEGWMLNVHAIDIRGAEDKMGCAECRCNLYNVTVDGDGGALPSSYGGGLSCCRDDKRCKVKEGLHGEKRSLYLRYTVKYVDWDSSLIVPVKIYVLDITDDWTQARHNCVVEFDIETCDVGVEKNDCIDSKVVSVSLPSGGDVVYGVGHQHAGATGTALYGEGGREICSSKPRYGEGNEAGNEVGFIVGMSTCYPSPAGSVKISAGETLTFVSNYSSVHSHTGVMTLFYLLLADSSPKPPTLADKITTVPFFVWPIVLLGVGLLLVALLASKGKFGNAEGYEAIV
ncbi:hypothetical protein C2S53_014565 [Perilla frutescens var. hirtella]|uniref:Uncharacterized protein n=1 Tax=Perilla frutescens var. hirtella TaxID=608512 RepID=A0AAD4IRN4_PERFH|nr:hypothetical protein C2S53_014565 [Perilla frutescens var. hirtella]